MNVRIASLAVAVVAAGCGGDPFQSPPRVGVAKAAITVAPNPVSCSSPARAAFDAALCVCEDLDLVGQGVFVGSSDGLATATGVNGTTHVVGTHKFAGDLLSWRSIDGTGTLLVRDNATTTGDLNGTGTVSVGKDLSVGGDLSTVGELSVGGLARVAGTVSHTGDAPGLRVGQYVAPAAPPCGCEPSKLLDVAAEVAKAKASNDNATIGLAALNSVGDLTLTLEGGRYYLEGLRAVGTVKLVVRKPSALYVDGDFETVGRDEIAVDENASLDLYVDGKVENVGTWQVGGKTLAGVVRLYVGGQNPLVQSVGDKDFVGAIYAPTAPFELVGDTRIRGAIFAKSLTGVGHLLVDYAKPAMPAEGGCP